MRKTKEDEDKDKAVRKLVHAVIEHEGGNSTVVKEQIDADYRRGIVRYKDVRIGEYQDGNMVLKGDGIKLEARYRALLE